MDTLSFLMQILGAFIECAKIVAVIVAFVLLLGFCKRFPLKLRKFIPHIAATAFLITVATSNCEQFAVFIALCWNRLGAIILALYGSVSMILILFTIVLVKSLIERKALSYSMCLSLGMIRGKRGVVRDNEAWFSNSYLAMTPVLLS